MNVDDLKAEWRAEMQASEGGQLRFDRVRGDVREFNRAIGFGTFVFIGASICGCVLAIVFGWVTLPGVTTDQKLSILAYVIATIWISYSLLRARRVGVVSDTWTLRERLELETERVRRQRNLWRNGGLFMLAPLLIFAALSLPWRLYPVPIAVYALTFWLVRWTVRKRIDPLLMRLERLHRELAQVEAGAP
jgi:hypothetical protein